jgi:parvulin-like peptidyl-prolyl isomerase
LLKRMLVGAIETKLIYLDFLRLVPPDKVPEIHKKVHKKFDGERVPELLEKAKVASALELDTMLRKYGSSLSKSRRMFTEQVLGHSMVAQIVRQHPEVSHEEMLTHYREHAAEYDLPAKARWEELMVEKIKFPGRSEAYAALAALGNEVLRGAKFDAVAKRGSQGFTADQGGYHDWTTRGSLVSKVVDDALFTLPEGKLSEILEDDRGFYILRVIERREAGRVPFIEAQVEIKKRLVAAKQDKERQAYLDKLRKRTPVSTIFDEPGAPLYSPFASAAAD